MSTLVKSNLERSLEVGSLKELVRAKTSQKVLLLIDVSGSMGYTMRNSKQRIDGLRESVREIQKSHQTDMIAFGLDQFNNKSAPSAVSSSNAEVGFVTTIPDPHGGTPLHSAIDLAKQSEAGRCVVISDGVPDSRTRAMESARSFGGRIDVVFVGNPGEPGEEFLRQLAEATGGTSFTGDLSEPKQLGKGIVALIEGAKDDDEDDE